jgi:hypothetical protein
MGVPTHIKKEYKGLARLMYAALAPAPEYLAQK